MVIEWQTFSGSRTTVKIVALSGFFKRRFIEINKTIYIIAERERHKEYS